MKTSPLSPLLDQLIAHLPESLPEVYEPSESSPMEERIQEEVTDMVAHLLNSEEQGRMKETLRVMVDAWMDSGKDGEIDRPHKRTIGKLKRTTILLSGEVNDPKLDGAQPEAVEFETIPVEGANVFAPLERVLSYGARRRLELSGDGFAVGRYRPNRPPPYTAGELHRCEEDKAGRMFETLLRSEFRSRLHRCVQCRRYLVNKKNPRKETAHGAFCEGGDCRRVWARIRMKDANGERNAHLLTLAAPFWLEWKPEVHGEEWKRWDSKKRDSERSKWIAKRMRPHLPKWKDSISGRWVTENQKKIEAEGVRGRNGKG